MVNTQSIALPGFDEELERAETDIARLSSRLDHQSADLQGQVRLLYRMFHRASLTGRMAHFEEVATQLDDVLGRFGPKEDLCLLRANLGLRFHRLGEARRDLAEAPMLSSRVEARMLLADIDMQEGRYDEAKREYEALIAEDPTWDKFARLAYWHGKHGDISESERLYFQAEDDLSAKQMLSYAWLEVQRGLLAFNGGNYAKAWWHYRRAESSYPGHWFTDEHIAELHAAEERFDQAIEIMNSVVERTGKPELQQGLGEMHAWAGQKDVAQGWFDKAQRAYLESVERGGVHYFHHLADLYADAIEDRHEALVWARRDIELRSNFSTQSTLAWALYLNQQLEEALSYMRVALSSGMRDAILYSTAAEIFEAAGDSSMSRQCASVALDINPMHRRFRMHH
jgi:tetratricopeptide (TPR) repeat protein